MRKLAEDQKDEEAIDKVEQTSNVGLNKLVELYEDGLFKGGDMLEELAIKMSPTLQEEANQFVENNKDRVGMYAENPSLLKRDIEQQFSWMKYLKYLETALDAIAVVSLGFALKSLGTSVLAGAAIRAAGKWIIKNWGKRILVRLFTRQVGKVIAKTGGSIAVRVGQQFLLHAMRYVKWLLVYDLLATILNEVGSVATRNFVLSQGNKYGLPQELLNEMAGSDPEDGSMTRSIISKYSDRVKERLTHLVSTKEGFVNLGIGAIMSKVFSMGGKALMPVKMALTANAQRFLSDKKNLSPEFFTSLAGKHLQRRMREKIEEVKGDAAEEEPGQQKMRTLTRAEIYQMLKRSSLPKATYPSLTSNIEEELERKEKLIVDQQQASKRKDEAKKIVQKKIEDTEVIGDQIKEAMRELATLEFIIANKKFLLENRSSLDNLLVSVVDEKTTTAELLDEFNVNQVTELVSILKDSNNSMIDRLVSQLSSGRSGHQLQKEILQHYRQQAQVGYYKKQLQEQVFGMFGGTSSQQVAAKVYKLLRKYNG